MSCQLDKNESSLKKKKKTKKKENLLCCLTCVDDDHTLKGDTKGGSALCTS